MSRIFVFASEVEDSIADRREVLIVLGQDRKIRGAVCKLQIRIGYAGKVYDLFFGKILYLTDKGRALFIDGRFRCRY